MNDDSNKGKLLSALCHGSIFFSGLVVAVGIPLVILIVSDDSIVKDNAKEALNFHFNVWLYGIIFGILTWILIGWVLLAILGLVTLIMPIFAIISVIGNPNQVFRYPFIFRLL
jgi:uncharacterized Tic20 family protein